MKITGNRSISSIIKIFLIILFTICIATIIAVPIIVENQGTGNFKQMILNETLGSTVVCIYLSAIPALVMLYQFIKIFQHLKDNELFCEDNVKRLSIISIYCFVISTIYFITAIFAIATITKYFQEFVYYILFSLIILAIIFGVAGIGIKILNEIYKKAIEYKEENDFTI